MDAFITRKRRRGDDIKGKTEIDIDREASISPPPKRNPSVSHGKLKGTLIDLTKDEVEVNEDDANQSDAILGSISPRLVPSPIQLNHVQDLPAKGNVETLKLSDILGDPMIQECRLFNYLFDIDFIMCGNPWVQT